MRIESLKRLASGHAAVRLEDGTELPTTLGVVAEMRLFAGRELDEEALGRLRAESGRALAREKALSIVSRRQMSAMELRRKLRDKGVTDDDADYCVNWMRERELLDEPGYAAAVVRHYGAKGYGEGRIRQELLRRGIPRGLWEEALSAMPEEEGAAKLDRFIAARLRDPDDRGDVRRVSAALSRRGYSEENIRAALARFGAGTAYEE